MAFSIDEFKSSGLVWGGARTSLFQIQFSTDFPSIQDSGVGSGQPTEVAKKIAFLAMAASLPPSDVDYIDVPYMSRKIKINGDRTFPNWSMTVMNDEDFMIRRALEGWHEAINSREPNRQQGSGFAPISMYKRDIIVHQYGKTGTSSGTAALAGTGALDAQPIYSYTLVGAFPTAVDAISVDWSNVNQVEQFDVQFAYDYWQPRIITSGSSLKPQVTQLPGIQPT